MQTTSCQAQLIYPKNWYKYLIISILCFNFSHPVLSQETFHISDTSRVFEMPQVEVIANREDRLFRHTPGVAVILRSGDIRALQPLSGNDALRRVPGLHIVDEEGAGLRINIGVRGLDPDRSRNVLILEDGIPVALNPYGEPEMYFTPLIDKMEAVEVLKGSGQLLFGPQTVGGVINYITPDPPEGVTHKVKISGGQNGFMSTHLRHGRSRDRFGYLFSFTHKRADAMGPTRFSIVDLSMKMKWQTSVNSSIGLKVGVYDEQSNSTYIGITQAMYDQGGQDFVILAPDDILPVRRYHASLTHKWDASPRLQVQTTAFAYTISRNWRRQEFGMTAYTPNQTGVIWGDTTITGGAIYMRNRSSWRNRQFEVAGLESKMNWTHTLVGANHNLQVGVRALVEKAEEQFIQGNTADAFGGNMRDNEVRRGFAVSPYVVNEVRISDRLSANLGLRLESFEYERHIRRGRFTVGGVPNTVRDTSVLTESHTFALIPGAGINFTLYDKVSLFAGVHRGFAPPRTKDAITSDGIALDVEKEISTNYELGARIAIGSFFTFHPAIFFLDFQNQIIPSSQSSGNQNATGLTNGGRTQHIGLEADLRYNVLGALGTDHALLLGTTLTLVRSRYAADRFLRLGEMLVNIRDNKLPYAPAMLMNHHIGFTHRNGLGIHLYGHYTASQYSDELNTVIPSADGLTGRIDARYVMDATLIYQPVKGGWIFSAGCKNLTGERYIVSRRPQGIKVGLSRFITAGVELTF